jgi:hypothetical protein
MEILNDLDPILRSFWYVAIPASIVFLFQTIMTFMGSDASDGLSADFDGDFEHDEPLQIFSLRNLINFLLGFSWTGISFYNLIPNKILLIVVALGIGVLFVFVFFVIIKQMQKLSEDNSFKISETLNKTGEVYLNIPASKTGHGKILISIKGSSHELTAVTEHEAINTGTLVKVSKIENNNILIVTKI